MSDETALYAVIGFIVLLLVTVAVVPFVLQRTDEIPPLEPAAYCVVPRILDEDGSPTVFRYDQTGKVFEDRATKYAPCKNLPVEREADLRSIPQPTTAVDYR